MKGWFIALLIATTGMGKCLALRHLDPDKGIAPMPFAQPKLFVHPDPSAPLVAIEVWIQAGSAHETRETSGAAHLLEHMIFKGTAQHPPGALDAAVESAGGVLEASTERDWTRYRMAVLPDRWEAPLGMLMEHLFHPALPEADLARERALILQDEYAFHRADPLRVARYALYAQAYGEHPYALPPLGIPDSLARLSREQLMAFHARFYRPDRMVIVVVGPVEPERVRQVVSRFSCGEAAQGQAEKALGHDLLTAWQEPHPPAELARTDAAAEKPHACTVEFAQSHLFTIAVPAPAATQPEAMLAAEVIRLALAEPYHGRLWTSDEGQIDRTFASLQSEYIPRLQPSLMLFFFQPYPDAGEDWKQRIRQRWQAAIQQIIEGRARPQLEQAKQWLIARHQQAMRNPLERARLYAFYATLGLPNLPDEYALRVQSLAIVQIEQVAQAMFGSSGWRMTSSEEQVASENFTKWAGEENFGGEGRGAISEGRADRRSESEIFRQTLASGVRVIALRQPGARQIVLQVLIATGADAERDFPPGTSELTARMLFTTTLNETQASLAYRIARSGGSLQLHWEPIGVRITALAEPATIENVLSLLREGLVRAAFEPEGLNNALQAALAERHCTDGAHELPLYEMLVRQLRLKGGLYASAEQLQQVRLEDVKAFYHRYYRPDRFVIVVAGDLPVERLTELMLRYFGAQDDWKESLLTSRNLEGEPPGELRHNPMPTEMVVSALSYPSTAPTIYIGFGVPMPVRSPEEYAALLVRQAMLCEGKGSLLFQQFREAQGIGYAFGGRVIVWRGEGLLLGFLQMGAGRESRCEELLNHLRATLHQKVSEPDILRRAIALVEARWRRDQLDLFERTRRLALAEASGVGYLAEQNLPDLLKKIGPTIKIAPGDTTL